MQLARSVFKNSIFNASTNVIVKIGGVFFTIILARMLQPELFGIYHLALSIGLFFLTFTDMGINSAMVRYVSRSLGENDKTLARSYYRYLLKIKIIITPIFSLGIILFAEPAAMIVFNKPLLVLPLQVAGLYLFIQSIFDFLSNSFNAFQRFEYISIGHVTVQILRLVFVPLLILLGYSVFGAMLGTLLAVIGGGVVLFFILLKNYSYILLGDVKNIYKKDVIKYLSYLTIASVGGVFFAYVDSIMLGIFLPAEFVGYYRAAYNTVFAISGIISISAVLFPVFSQLNKIDLKNAFDRVFKLSSIISFPCAAGLAFFAGPLIGVVYGQEYLSAVVPLYVLSLLILSSSLDFFTIIFTSQGMPEYPTKIVLASSILNVILNYFFIIQWGMIGAAIATVIARYLNVIFLGLLSKKHFHIYPKLALLLKPFISTLGMCLFLYIVPAPDSIVIGISEIISAAFVYFVILISIKGFNRDDISYMKTIINR